MCNVERAMIAINRSCRLGGRLNIMASDPAQAFNNYVQDHSPWVVRDGLYRPKFRGRQDIAEIERADLGSLLRALQNGITQAFAQRRKVPDHVYDLPFYFDYIDSEFSDAVAFRDDSHAFIGVTVPFINEFL